MRSAERPVAVGFTDNGDRQRADTDAWAEAMGG